MVPGQTSAGLSAGPFRSVLGSALLCSGLKHSDQKSHLLSQVWKCGNANTEKVLFILLGAEDQDWDGEGSKTGESGLLH